MKNSERLFPLGMVGVIAYFFHVFLGEMLWHEYNPVTMDISSLTAVGAPNAGVLRVFTIIYGLCFLLFVVAMVRLANKKYHSITRLGYFIFLVMAITTVIGYQLFPLTGNKTEMNFQNTMHILVTVIVVFSTITALFLISFGYLRKEGMKTLGRVCMVAAILITCFGALNPIGMGLKLNILGLTERLVIYTLQVFVFFLSYIYTTKSKLIHSPYLDK